jgi:hypothetical protein
MKGRLARKTGMQIGSQTDGQASRYINRWVESWTGEQVHRANFIVSEKK